MEYALDIIGNKVRVGDKVKIIPLENLEGRIIEKAFSVNTGTPMVKVRYFVDCRETTVWLYLDEVAQ